MKSWTSLVLLAWTLSGQAADLQLELPEPRWLLGPVTAPLTQREAGLQPREQGIALRLSPLLSEGDYVGAQALIDEELDPDAEAPYEDFSPALNLVAGQIYLANAQVDKAEAALRVAITQLPDFVRAHHALGLLYLRQERLDEAREHITRAVILGSVEPALFGYLGYLNQRTGQYWAAVGAYQQALMLEHDNPQWQQGLLLALLAARQYESAQAFVEELLGQRPNESALWLYRAQLALQVQAPERALASLEVAIRLGDASLANLQACVQLHLQVGSMARALELLQGGMLTRLDPDYVDQLLAYLVRQGQDEYALSLLTTIRNDWGALSNLRQSRVLTQEAALALRGERREAAEAALEEAVALDPGNAEALLKLGDLHAEARRYIQAELLYERASAYPEFRERALLGLGQLAIDQADYVQALALLRQVLQQNPDNGELRENLRVLESLTAAPASAL